MKSKDRFFVDEDYGNVHTKKKDKFGTPSRGGLVTDKFGNSIRLGDFVQATLKDGTILNECEVIEINSGSMLTLVLDDGESTKEIHSNKVILLSI
jgi:hypothetical protein